MSRRRGTTSRVAGIAIAGLVAGGIGVGLATEASPSQPGGESTVLVGRVIDGDTFVTGNGERVRVLGINACEHGTTGGDAATARAQGLLAGRLVVLRAEPGHDLDIYGRSLRYVRLPDGRDFGEVTVPERDVEVYRGRNDASREYVARLRAIDGPARVC